MPTSHGPITLPGNPTAAGHAVTKGYVDTAVSGVVAGAGGAQKLTPTTVKTSAYTASPGDYVPVDLSGGSFTITLPTAPANGTRFGYKVTAVATGNVLTVARGGSSDVFNKTGGSTSFTASLLNQGGLLQYDNGIWYIQADNLALSQLDARYAPIDRVPAPAWAASTAYRAGDLVWQSNVLYRRKTAGTSGSSFDPAQWDTVGPSSGGGSGSALITTYSTPPVNGWLVMAVGSVSNPTRPEGEMAVGLQFLPPGTYDAVGLQLAGAGGTGSILRVVVYGDDGNGKPGALLAEATTSGTSSGFKTIVLPTPIVSPSTGLVVWAGFANQGAAPTRASVWESNLATTPPIYPSGSTPAMQVNNNVSWISGGQTGAAPASASGFTQSWGHPRMGFRRSA